MTIPYLNGMISQGIDVDMFCRHHDHRSFFSFNDISTFWTGGGTDNLRLLILMGKVCNVIYNSARSTDSDFGVGRELDTRGHYTFGVFIYNRVTFESMMIRPSQLHNYKVTLRTNADSIPDDRCIQWNQVVDLMVQRFWGSDDNDMSEADTESDFDNQWSPISSTGPQYQTISDWDMNPVWRVSDAG